MRSGNHEAVHVLHLRLLCVLAHARSALLSTQCDLILVLALSGSYNGCPFSASQAWSCGDGCIVGPCIMMKYTDTTTVSQRWLCCPAEEWKRVEGGAPPTATEMAR
jgi:hypothetical protein